MLRIEITNNGTANIPENMAHPLGGEPFYFIGNYDYKIYLGEDVVNMGNLGEHNRLSGWPGLLSLLNKKINGDRFTD